MSASPPLGAIALAAVLAVPIARGADPAPVSKSAAHQLLAGKVLTVQFADPLRLTLARDGKVDALGPASGIRAVGTWSVDAAGRLCIESPNPVLAGCRALVRGERGLGMTKTDGTGFFPVSDIR